MPTVQFDIPADHKYLSVLGTAVSAFVENIGDATLAYSVQLAIHEVCANIIDHAYENPTPENHVTVQLTLDEVRQEMVAAITDQGEAFDPLSREWPLATVWQPVETGNGPVFLLTQVAEPDLEQERGRGMFMIWQLMDEVIYQPRANQNLWRLTRRF
ncbi:MAG: ATP-binding protein [Candidatus Promineifilaceae bacterium]